MANHQRPARNRRAIVIAAATGLAVAAALTATAATAVATPHSHAAYKYPTVQNIGPRFTVAGGAAVLPTTQTVAHWHSSFVDGLNHQTYGFNMVGADPNTNTSTTVPTVIVPLTINFAADGGTGFAGGTVANDAVKSPIYTPAKMPDAACGETAQYLDAVMRCEFGKAGTSSGYGVQLTETTLPAQTMTVPQGHGAIYDVIDPKTGKVLATVGLVDASWFSAELQAILASSHVPTTTLPVVISNNVYLYVKSIANCCIIGFHGAGHPTGLGAGSVHGNGSQPVPTFAWASWIPTDVLFGPGLTDVAALSHEISEWGHDPFTDNFVNNWEVAGEPQYGCSNILETGDPLVGFDFGVGSNPDPATGPQWHLQDEAYLWWFSRDPLTEPTPASNGAYSFDQTFTTPAGTC